MEDKLYSIALSVISSPTLNGIWDYIYTLPPTEIYKRIEKNSELKTQGFISVRYKGRPIEAAKAIYDCAKTRSIRIIDFWDENYPHLLKQIDRPPLVLYYQGNITASKSIAIVGTRKSDKRSSQITRKISTELSAAGFTIVSGMAIGIDREAHIGALQRNGPTFGVLANGIGIVYPSFNKDLYSAIQSSDNSAIISEYPPDIFAGKWTFVRRNRIISGLSLGTVVVKAGKKSGSLITSKYAIEQNREVFVCPGLAFDEGYSGCHNLIRNGAVLVSSTEDIIKELPVPYKSHENDINNKDDMINDNVKWKDYKNGFNNITDTYRGNSMAGVEYTQSTIGGKILNLLSDGERDMDSLVRIMECNTNEVNEAIIMLELSGDISRNGNIISRS